MLAPLSARTLLFAAACATLASSTALAQSMDDGVVVGNDVVNDGLYIRHNNTWERLGFFGPVWGLAADPATCTLYIASSQTLASGRGVGVLHRIVAGNPIPEELPGLTALTTTGETALITIVGLAFRPTPQGGELIGYRSVTGTPEGDVPEGFYRINPETGLCTPIWRIPAADRAKWDFGGLDFDISTGVLWGSNDNSAVGIAGGVAGLFRINLGTGVFSLAAAYPPAAQFPGTGIDVRDIDGLAAGNGRVWLVPDEANAMLRPLNALTNTYIATLDTPTPFFASNLQATFSAGAFAPCLLAPVCDTIDFNSDGLFPDDSDLVDFLSVLAGGPCSTGTCNDIDFNNDGLFPDDSDLIAFLRVLAGGAC